jgi:hypothetical protein
MEYKVHSYFNMEEVCQDTLDSISYLLDLDNFSNGTNF